MFKINCELRQSTIPGIGLGVFTLEDIKKGDLVWAFDENMDMRIHVSDLNALEPSQLTFINKYAWREGDFIYLPCDLNKFVNHSNNPNIGCFDRRLTDIAFRDIKAGEELFADYSSFDDDYRSYASELR